MAEARSLKAQGVTSGVPDIFCAWPTKDYAGLWLEFKSHNGKITDSQKAMGKSLLRAGYQYFVVYSWSEARNVLSHYLGDTATRDK